MTFDKKFRTSSSNPDLEGFTVVRESPSAVCKTYHTLKILAPLELSTRISRIQTVSLFSNNLIYLQQPPHTSWNEDEHAVFIQCLKGLWESLIPDLLLYLIWSTSVAIFFFTGSNMCPPSSRSCISVLMPSYQMEGIKLGSLTQAGYVYLHRA